MFGGNLIQRDLLHFFPTNEPKRRISVINFIERTLLYVHEEILAVKQPTPAGVSPSLHMACDTARTAVCSIACSGKPDRLCSECYSDNSMSDSRPAGALFYSSTSMCVKGNCTSLQPNNKKNAQSNISTGDAVHIILDIHPSTRAQLNTSHKQKKHQAQYPGGANTYPTYTLYRQVALEVYRGLATFSNTNLHIKNIYENVAAKAAEDALLAPPAPYLLHNSCPQNDCSAGTAKPISSLRVDKYNPRSENIHGDPETHKTAHQIQIKSLSAFMQPVHAYFNFRF